MAVITKNGKPSISTPQPCNAHRVGSGLICGEDLAPFDACFIQTDKLVYRSLATLQAAPPAPTVAGNGAGSAFAAGTHMVQTTYVTAQGESLPSPAVAVTLTAAQNIRVSAQGGGVLPAGVTGGNFYVDGVKAIATVASAAGSIPQTDLTGATPAVAGQPPFVSTAFLDGKYRVDGFAAVAAKVAQKGPVTLYDGVDCDYGTGLTPGDVWLDTTTAGAINTTPVAGLRPCGQIIDATRIRVFRSSKIIF